jgi:hypothetical protein
MLIPVVTVSSVLAGDRDETQASLVFRTAVERHRHTFVADREPGQWRFVADFWLIGAGYALYSARKPKFKAAFQPLGAPSA